MTINELGKDFLHLAFIESDIDFIEDNIEYVQPVNTLLQKISDHVYNLVQVDPFDSKLEVSVDFHPNYDIVIKIVTEFNTKKYTILYEEVFPNTVLDEEILFEKALKVINTIKFSL